MPLYTFNPVTDRRWDALVASHPGSSVFHRREWLQTLLDTYGYQPIAITSAEPGKPLSDGIAFCEVTSWITGKRLVSLPFSDHSELMLSEATSGLDIAEWLVAATKTRHLRYIELRPVEWSSPAGSLSAGQIFWLHTLDLTKPLEELFRSLDKNNLQRRIRKAERENLEYEKGSSEQLLDEFFKLLLITRRRHQLLPQPRSWFRNLAKHFKSDFEIRVARKDRHAIAAIVTLRHRQTIVYKYGCSDEKYHSLAGMPFLFWKLISESKAEQAVEVDFGRTEPDNEGLLRFKDHFGTTRRQITYLRYPKTNKEVSSVPSNVPFAGKIFSVLPGAVSWRLGSMLYRHMG
jgi:CelD/BcsL family acetyltransferase involved in cellulose biosynthesis